MQRTFTHLFNISKWIKFLRKIFDLVFWSKSKKVKITSKFSSKNKTKQFLQCKFDVRRNDNYVYKLQYILNNCDYNILHPGVYLYPNNDLPFTTNAIKILLS